MDVSVIGIPMILFSKPWLRCIIRGISEFVLRLIIFYWSDAWSQLVWNMYRIEFLQSFFGHLRRCMHQKMRRFYSGKNTRSLWIRQPSLLHRSCADNWYSQHIINRNHASYQNMEYIWVVSVTAWFMLIVVYVLVHLEAQMCLEGMNRVRVAFFWEN